MISEHEKEYASTWLELSQHRPISLRSKVETYLGIFGLTSSSNPIKLKERDEWRSIYNEAVDLLSAEDQQFLDTLVVELVWGAHPEAFSQRSGTNLINGEVVDGRVLNIYPSSMVSTSKDLTRDGYVDWMRRLLMHEIGHVRDGMSDEEMADKYGY